jgi:hypothetical protein
MVAPADVERSRTSILRKGRSIVKVLVGCEFSGRVRDAFIALGHDAVSCDLIGSEVPGPHIIGDVREWFSEGWDIAIIFPPCDDLAVSGARWFPEKRADGRQARAVTFFMEMVNAPIPRICIENPVGIMSTLYRKPDQIIQPWQFGDGFVKKTCLWLKGLPKLSPTKIVDGRVPEVHYERPGPDRKKNRSRTYPGIAVAMAEQFAEPFSAKGDRRE